MPLMLHVPPCPARHAWPLILTAGLWLLAIGPGILPGAAPKIFGGCPVNGPPGQTSLPPAPYAARPHSKLDGPLSLKAVWRPLATPSHKIYYIVHLAPSMVGNGVRGGRRAAEGRAPPNARVISRACLQRQRQPPPRSIAPGPSRGVLECLPCAAVGHRLGGGREHGGGRRGLPITRPASS